MKPSDFQKTTQCQFDSLLKKVVRGSVRDYKKQQSRLKKKEISFCELPEIVIEKLMTWDDYDTDCTTFQVCGMDIKIFDDTLAEAIQTLPEKKRNILLMFYFLGMSDTEIGEMLSMNRRSSHRNRTGSLEEIRTILKEKNFNV